MAVQQQLLGLRKQPRQQLRTGLSAMESSWTSLSLSGGYRRDEHLHKSYCVTPCRCPVLLIRAFNVKVSLQNASASVCFASCCAKSRHKVNTANCTRHDLCDMRLKVLCTAERGTHVSRTLLALSKWIKPIQSFVAHMLWQPSLGLCRVWPSCMPIVDCIKVLGRHLSSSTRQMNGTCGSWRPAFEI